eukprot:COSAG05_NODE_2103_length_3555_cov_3.669271_1_plen_343_part_00
MLCHRVDQWVPSFGVLPDPKPQHRISSLFSCKVRLGAVLRYGRVIHEFDPWFNYRATEYMHEHGVSAFLSWFDHSSWYPLGRPIGTTTYPGMMMSACGIHHVLNVYMDYEISLNDVCVFIPAGFSCVTVFFTYLLTIEVSRSPNAGVAAAGIMALLPAHLMRSVAGGYDNESVAVAAICSTFYFWVRSLRGDNSWWIGAMAGLSYCYMAAAWGGYTFVLNMIGVHASALILLGRYTPKLHRAYSLFFIIGTAGALQVPVIGRQPLQSVEQLGPLACFAALQMIACADFVHGVLKLPSGSKTTVRLVFVTLAIAVGAVLVNGVLPDGYLGPVSARVRGLFIKV